MTDFFASLSEDLLRCVLQSIDSPAALVLLGRCCHRLHTTAGDDALRQPWRCGIYIVGGSAGRIINDEDAVIRYHDGQWSRVPPPMPGLVTVGPSPFGSSGPLCRLKHTHLQS